MPDIVVLEAEERMEKSVSSIVKEFGKVQTGRASASLLDNVSVDYYGAKNPINKIATITTPEARLIVIQPWDKSIIKDIEKAIASSDLGLNPNSDGTLIRIGIPELTTERRQQLTKVVANIAEDGRVSVRNIRRDANENLKKMEKDKSISEDDLHGYMGDIQDLSDQHIERINQQLQKKEQELLEF